MTFFVMMMIITIILKMIIVIKLQPQMQKACASKDALACLSAHRQPKGRPDHHHHHYHDHDDHHDHDDDHRTI